MDFRDLHCHIYAHMRDEGGSIMNLCAQLEICVMNECLAVYEGRHMDFHYWQRGNPFHMFRARKLIRLGKTQINFCRHDHIVEQNLDRFMVSSYDLCALLKHLKSVSGDYGEWICVSIDKELNFWLEQPVDLNPFLLDHIWSANSFRVVY